ncbi:hypothetical protein GLYMA_10G179201v4 [Glycine max]|nr:hypothetical protein GLYMA_10G179201v4 [Glycine max]KAH1138855.1 hypothetical protein GYH30_028352 [Glycine max]
MRGNKRRIILSGPLICLLIMKQENVLSCFIPIFCNINYSNLVFVYPLVDGSIVHYNLGFSHHLLQINASTIGTFLDPAKFYSISCSITLMS